MTRSRCIEVIGSPVLRRVSRPFDLSGGNGSLMELVIEMERLLAAERGLGLAAPQAGENVRVFILDSSSLDTSGHRVFVNPVTEPYGPSCRIEEGCLSVPGLYEEVSRPSRCRVSATDEKGVRFELDLGGMAARAAQHENDHLDGILFVDRLGALRRRLLRRRLEAMAEAAGNEPDRRA